MVTTEALRVVLMAIFPKEIINRYKLLMQKFFECIMEVLRNAEMTQLF